jgi:glucodextranase-like protein
LRSLVIVSTLFVALAACSPIRTATPQPTEANQPAQTPAVPPTAASAASQPAPAATSAPPASNAGPLTLQVLSPQDNAVVNTPQITVSGVSSPGAVVSVNDDILVADATGQFQDLVMLSEGLNLIEVVASDTSGTEISAELTVTYEP